MVWSLSRRKLVTSAVATVAAPVLLARTAAATEPVKPGRVSARPCDVGSRVSQAADVSRGGERRLEGRTYPFRSKRRKV